MAWIFNPKLVPRRLIMGPAGGVLGYKTLRNQRSKLPIAATEGRLGDIPDSELALTIIRVLCTADLVHVELNPDARAAMRFFVRRLTRISAR